MKRLLLCIVLACNVAFADDGKAKQAAASLLEIGLKLSGRYDTAIIASFDRMLKFGITNDQLKNHDALQADATAAQKEFYDSIKGALPYLDEKEKANFLERLSSLEKDFAAARLDREKKMDALSAQQRRRQYAVQPPYLDEPQDGAAQLKEWQMQQRLQDLQIAEDKLRQIQNDQNMRRR